MPQSLRISTSNKTLAWAEVGYASKSLAALQNDGCNSWRIDRELRGHAITPSLKARKLFSRGVYKNVTSSKYQMIEERERRGLNEVSNSNGFVNLDSAAVAMSAHH